MCASVRACVCMVSSLCDSLLPQEWVLFLLCIRLALLHSAHCSLFSIASYRIASHWYRTEYKFNHKVCLRVYIYIHFWDHFWREWKSKSSRAEQQQQQRRRGKKRVQIGKECTILYTIQDCGKVCGLFCLAYGADCRQQAAKRLGNCESDAENDDTDNDYEFTL